MRNDKFIFERSVLIEKTLKVRLRIDTSFGRTSQFWYGHTHLPDDMLFTVRNSTKIDKRRFQDSNVYNQGFKDRGRDGFFIILDKRFNDYIIGRCDAEIVRQ